MAGHTYKKMGQTGKRELAPGKGVSEQSLQFGETPQLPGGAHTSRKQDRSYGIAPTAPSTDKPEDL
jgi:hypothetical protein